MCVCVCGKERMWSVCVSVCVCERSGMNVECVCERVW